MSKADEIRARAARATQRTRPAVENSETAGGAVQPAPPARPATLRAKPVRITADLPPQVYRGLIDYAASLATTQGRARIAHVQVIRALVSELAENEGLQAAIEQRVASQLET